MSARVSASSSTRSLRVLIFNFLLCFGISLDHSDPKCFLQHSMNQTEIPWLFLNLEESLFPRPMLRTCDNLNQRTNCCTLSLRNYLPPKSQVSSGHSLVCCCRIQTSELTLSSFQSSRYLLQRVKYLFSIPRVFCTLLDKVVTKSMMAGLDEMSEKKLNTTGSSSPSACWGGVSMHVPCIQRTNILVLKRKWKQCQLKNNIGGLNQTTSKTATKTKQIF